MQVSTLAKIRQLRNKMVAKIHIAESLLTHYSLLVTCYGFTSHA